MFKFFSHLPKSTALYFISLYQKSISPDHSVMGRFFHPYGACKFHPTCSVYSFQAIEKYGLIKGGLKSIRRIFHCHPWSKGGEDPLL